MAKILAKKNEAAKVETVPEPTKEVPKKLTPIKKIEAKAEPEKKVEVAPVVTPKSEPVVEGPKIERPAMPEGFCMELSDWEGVGVCYDINSNNCKTCTNDFPETMKVCVARADFLGIVATTGKTAKAKKTGEKAVRTNKSGKTPQSVLIDGYLKESKTLADMIILLAQRDFGGETEAGKRAAEVRIESHLKAIRTGTYCRAAIMLPFITYLATPAPTAKAVATPAK